MSKTSIPFATEDISALARSLRAQLGDRDSAPGHVELLNILARAAGYRNFQSLRAQGAAQDKLRRPLMAPKPVDYKQVEALMRHFDENGLLARWPAKASLREICVEVMWSRLPARRIMSEEQLNSHLRANHLFGDHALLRRQLCDLGMVTRTKDGREYKRVERKPSGEAVSLIRHLAERRAVVRGAGANSRKGRGQ